MEWKEGLIEINNRPLQTSTTDKLLKTVVVGGPSKEGDRRMYLDRPTIAVLNEIAQSSIVQRAQINRCGMQVCLYQRPDGHQYEVWTIIGLKPVPESSMDGLLDITCKD